MSSDTYSNGIKSLHYKVKAFLFSVNVEVKRVFSPDGQLRQITISTEIRIPPRLGRKKIYRARWDYVEGGVSKAQTEWDGKLQERTFGSGSTQLLDLANFFWGEQSSMPKDSSLQEVAWVQEGINCQGLQVSDSNFSFELFRHEKPLASVTGTLGGDQILESLDVRLKQSSGLGAPSVTVQRLG